MAMGVTDDEMDQLDQVPAAGKMRPLDALSSLLMGQGDATGTPSVAGGTPSDDNEESPRLKDRIMDDAQARSGAPAAPAHSNEGELSAGGAPADRGDQRLAELIAREKQLEQGPSKKSRILSVAAALAPLAAMPFLKNPGARAGGAQGIERGAGSLEAQQQQQQQQRLTERMGLQRDIGAQMRTQAQESSANLRAKIAEDAATQRFAQGQAAETGRNQRLLETLGNQTTEGAANRTSREGIAAGVQAGQNTRLGEKINQNMEQYRKTDEFKRWKENLDNDVKLKVAEMSQSKAPAAMMQTAEFATGGLNRIKDAEAAMNRLQDSGVMGSLPANKVEDWIFGKGLVDPSLSPQQRNDIGVLRSALGYTSSAAMRAHTGRTSREIYDDFKRTLGVGQDWDALKGAIQETRGMLTDYALAASDANIRSMRSGENTGGGAKPAGAQPGKGGAPPKFGEWKQRQGAGQPVQQAPTVQ